VAGRNGDRAPKSEGDREKLDAALAELTAEDPSFRVSTDQESGQTILKGMGELHLDIKVDSLKRTYRVDANIGAPQVAFRERVTKSAEVEYTHKKQTGRTGQFAAVKLVVEPNEPDKGYEFESKIVGGAVPKEFIAGVERGLNSVLNCGVVAGFPVVDVKVQLVDGKYHDVDSSAVALRNRIACGIPRSAAERQVGPARTDHEGRSGDARRLYRLGHQRPEFAARPDPGSRHARQRQRHQCDGAAYEHVRLRQ
jgi:translation elongation factor EF-G